MRTGEVVRMELDSRDRHWLASQVQTEQKRRGLTLQRCISSSNSNIWLQPVIPYILFPAVLDQTLIWEAVS